MPPLQTWGDSTSLPGDHADPIGMVIESVGSAALGPALPSRTTQLAEARARLRDAAPAGSWDAVLAEVKRLQLEQSMSPLTAMQTVYARLAAGWQPRA
jgi:hypothetical protein